MTDHPARCARLRELVASGRTVAALGATDALSARMIEAHGFECVYIGSYATAASRFGLPDTGLLSLDELAAHAGTIAAAVQVPVIADAEGGFNDPANMWRSVEAFERAGVAAIHIEDHSGVGKHTDVPQTLRPMREAAARIRAAVDARKHMLVVARSDALWVNRDLEDCIARLQAYADAGADMVFPTMADAAQLAEVRKRIARPAMIVDIPGQPLAAHAGAALVLFYGFSLFAQFRAMEQALDAFKQSGAFTGDAARLEALLGYADFTARARKYR
jgi:methylisocitrate lyase